MAVRTSLQTESTNDLGIDCARLKLEKKVVHEEVQIGFYAEESFRKVDEDGNLKNRVRVKIYQFNVIIFQQLVKECPAGKAKSPLEIGFEYHYFFASGRAPEHCCLVLEEEVVDELFDAERQAWNFSGWAAAIAMDEERS